MTNHKSTKFRAKTIMNGFEGQPFLKRWIDNHDGSEDVAEDEKTPCGTLTDTEASMLNSCAHFWGLYSITYTYTALYLFMYPMYIIFGGYIA